jgi:hypothetical protein
VKTDSQKNCAFLKLQSGTFVYTNPIKHSLQTIKHQLKCKKMITAAQQGTLIYLHGRRNEEGLEHGALAQAATLFSVTHNAYGPFFARDE